MSDKGGGLIGEIFEQGGTIVKQTAKAVAQAPGAIVSTAATQIGTPVGGGVIVQPSEESPDAASQKKVKQNVGSQKTNTGGSLGQHILSQLGQRGPTIQDEKKIEELRRELHGKYYQTLTPSKKQEERPTEKIEREKQQEVYEMQIKQQEEKKKEAISVVRAKNKAEKFRGVSG